MNYVIEPIDYGRELTPLLNFTVSDFRPEPYVPPGSITSTHNQPRFGRTNNFGTLINGSQEEVQDYVVGIIIGAMIILIVAICWFFAIICLKIAGPKRVHFLAGRLIKPAPADQSNNEGKGQEVVMAPPQNADGDVDEAVPITDAPLDPAVKKHNRAVWFVRLMFVISGLIVITSGGLFYGKGVVAFKDSLDEVRLGIAYVQDAANKAIKLTDEVLQAGEDIDDEMQPTREVEEQNSNQICGLDSDFSITVQETYDNLSAGVDDLKDMLAGTLDSFGDDLRSLLSLTEDIENQLDTADIFFYILIAISVIIIGLVIAMLVGVLFAWKGISNCFTKLMQYAILWPLFIFFLVLSWIFATVFLVASLAGADFCFSPDKYVEDVLNSMEDQFDGIIFGFIVYYVSGCTVVPSGDGEFLALAQQVQEVLNYAHGLTDSLGELPLERLVVLCGLTTQQAQAVSSLVDLAHSSIHVLNRSLIGLREVLDCSTFNPIYTTFVHQAFCVQGVSGLSYIFGTTMVIAIFSMVMVMLRAAIYPIKEAKAPLVAAVSGADAMEVMEYNEDSPQDKNDEAQEEDGGPVANVY